MHPHALDLPDPRRQRADLGLEDDLVALEAGERATRRDELRDPRAVARAAVARARVDADLLGEHRDGRGEVALQLDRAHRAHQRIGRHRGRPASTISGWSARTSRHGAQCTASVSHIGSTSSARPTIDEQLRPPRRARSANWRSAARSPRMRHEVGAGEAQPGQVRARRPQLAAEPPRIQPGHLDARGDHAGGHRILIQRRAYSPAVPVVKEPRSGDTKHVSTLPYRSSC